METSTDDDLSFDVVKYLPEDICDNIFGNLKAPDLLKASLVSSEWYNYIAKSSDCMQKLKLTFSPKELEETRLVEMEGILTNSDRKSCRKYENLELNDLKFFYLRNILLTCGRQWKKVTMTSVTFSTKLEFNNFIAFVEPFVEKLKMKEINIQNANPKKQKLSDQEMKKSLSFPNLKVLEVECFLESIIEVFQDVVTLTELQTYDEAYAATYAVEKMICCNKGLKKLSTNYNVFRHIVFGEISSDFKLISLHILDRFRFSRPYFHLSDVLKTNFKLFLELHMKTLERFTVDDWMGLEAVKVIFHMPKLKHFTLKGLHRMAETVDWKEISFKQSLSLTSLDLYYFGRKVEILGTFFIATPNVKKLKLRTINDENIACISELLPNLESLSVTWFKVRDVTDKSYLPNLKEFSMNYYDKRIKESKAEEDRSKFESLFLAEKNPDKAYDMW